MTDFRSIVHYQLRFEYHPHDPKAQGILNAAYGGRIPRVERFFVDPATMDDLKPNKELLKMLLNIVRDEMIIPYAIHTNNAMAVIKPIVNQAQFSVLIGTHSTRMNRDNLERALQVARAGGKDTIEIRMSMTHAAIPQSTIGHTYLDWSIFNLQAPANPAVPPPPPMTPAAIVAAVAGTSAVDIANALASALSGMSFSTPAPVPSSTSQGTGSGPGPSTATNASSILFTYNSASLPPEVRRRFDNGIARGLLIANGLMYYEDGMDKIVLADGSMFINQPADEKGFLKMSVFCEDNTHVGIRAWYDNFVQVCHSYGYYAHPSWCFHKDHGGDRGFTVGSAPDDDLPARLELAISCGALMIYRVLLNKDMFPAKSRLPGIVRSCDGDGYRALKAILFESHPAFFDQPSVMISSYPKQKDKTMLEYYKMFQDFLQLRAYISSVSASLDDTAELDLFIGNAKYNSYLNRVTRDERRLSSLQHKYRGTQLVETLDKFLNAPDSPAKRAREFASASYSTPAGAARTSGGSGRPAGAGFHRTLGVQVQTLAAISDEENADTDDDDDDDTVDPIDVELNAIKVPRDADSREVYHVYCASVHRIQADPKAAISSECIVCGENHRFDKCEVLADHDFLKGHYVRYCQQLRRDRAARAAMKKPRTIKQPPKHKIPVNFVDDGGDIITSVSEEEAEDDVSPDFQDGRVPLGDTPPSPPEIQTTSQPDKVGSTTW